MPPTAQEMHTLSLTPQEINKLIDAVFACPVMDIRNRRDTVLLNIRSEISGVITRDDARRFDVENIVRTCAKYPGGIRELIKAMRQFDYSSQPMQHLKEVEESIFFVPKIITKDHLRRLLTIGEKVGEPTDVLLRLFKASGGTNLPVVSDETAEDTLGRILRCLANAPRQSDKIFPILGFAERLACHANAVADELTHWVDDVAAYLGVPGSEIEALRHTLQWQYVSSSASQPSLMIMLRPIDTDPTPVNSDQKQFAVRAWLWKSSDDIETLMPPEDVTDRDEDIHTRGDIPGVLHDLLYTECLPRLGTLDELAIEFFVPLPLLDDDIEQQWTIETGIEDEKPIGIVQPIVVRSLERIASKYTPTLWSQWKRKWEQFPQHSQLKACETVFYDCNIAQDKTQKPAEVLAKTEIIFLALTRMPPFDTAASQMQLFKDLLNTGIPIALWLTADPAPSQDIRQTFNLILEGELGHLPATIWRKRKEAPDASGQQGYRLKLLWDDHNRLPFDPLAVMRGKVPGKAGSKQ